MKVARIRAEVSIMSNSGHGHFFAVGRDSFVQACGLGINAASAFLTMACGTGRDHTTTRWSATSVENHAGIGWRRADESITALRHSGLVKRTDDKSDKRKPAYQLKCEGDLIWLPKSIVTGVGDEIPPLRKLRQAQCAMTLRLFIELYRAQNLRDDGGISRDVVYQKYERREFGGRGAYTVWAFDKPSCMTMTWCDVTEPHRRDQLTPEECKRGCNAAVDFFARFDKLRLLGLVERVPCLYEGDDGEPIHTLENPHLLDIMHEAAESLITEGMAVAAESHDYLVPVVNHMEAVQVYAMERLRYRPHTRATSAWWARERQAEQEYIKLYREIADGTKVAAVA